MWAQALDWHLYFHRRLSSLLPAHLLSKSYANTLTSTSGSEHVTSNFRGPEFRRRLNQETNNDIPWPCKGRRRELLCNHTSPLGSLWGQDRQAEVKHEKSINLAAQKMTLLGPTLHELTWEFIQVLTKVLKTWETSFVCYHTLDGDWMLHVTHCKVPTIDVSFWKNVSLMDDESSVTYSDSLWTIATMT